MKKVRRCALFECRSGYKLTRQIAAIEESNRPAKVSIFRSPIRDKKSSGQYDLKWGICEKHCLLKDFFLTGKAITEMSETGVS